MQDIKAIIFDLDGTLFDTREMIYQQWAQIIKKHAGTSPAKEEILAQVYGPFHEIIARVLNTEDPELIADAMNSFQHIREEVQHLFRLYDDVHTTLQALHDRGIKLAAYTGSDRKALTLLEQQKMLHFFEHVVTAEDVTKHKPDPEGVQMILEGLDIKPEQAAMIGDVPPEIEMAKRARLGLAIGITHGLGSRESLEAAQADAIIDDLPSLLALLPVAG